MLSTADLRPSRWHVTEEKLVFLRLHFLDLAHQLLLPSAQHLMRCAKCCSTAVLCSAASKSSNFLHLDVLDGLFESGQQRRHVARQLAEAIPVRPCHVLQKVKSVISMIFDSAVDACGRVAPAERLLLPVLLAYALLRGLRYITDDIIAHLRRLWLHLA
jgi:hypothetical protein